MPTTAAAPEKQLAGFIGKFTPEMAAFIRAARKNMRERLPNAIEMVYDNYNFLVIGYGPSERASEAVFSLAAHSRGVTLCFLQGAGLPDPKRLLRGSGNVVRNVRLESAATLDQPDVRALMKHALVRAKVPMPARGVHLLVIKLVSAKQRPRRAEPRAAERPPGRAGSPPRNRATAAARGAVARPARASGAAKPRAGAAAARKRTVPRPH